MTTIAKRLAITIVTVAFVSASCMPVASVSYTETECDRMVSQITNSIFTELDRDRRSDLAASLAARVRLDAGCQGMSGRSIDRVIGLLSDRDDPVRSGAARTLSELGPRAKRAVPALVAALDKWKKENRELIGPTSRDAICEALDKITGKPWPDRVCDAVRPVK